MAKWNPEAAPASVAQFTGMLNLPVKVHDPACPLECRADHPPALVVGFGVLRNGDPVLLLSFNGKRLELHTLELIESLVAISTAGLIPPGSVRGQG